MPTLSQITSTFFVDLITRLGVRPPPPEAFLLSNVVQPVSIVDSGITLTAAVSTQTLDTPFTAGAQVNPVAGTVLADTGALPAGIYAIYATVGKILQAGAGADFDLQRRDAANAVTVWGQRAGIFGASQETWAVSLTVVLLLNERIRLVEVTNATTTILANIWALKVG